MIKTISHITVFVRDQDAALSFYVDKLGFHTHTDAEFGPMRWLTICPPGNKNLEISLMLATSEAEKALVGKQAASKPFLALEVNDCQKTFEDLKNKGVTFLDTPKQEPWGTAVTAKDLYGNIIYLCQPSQQK